MKNIIIYHINFVCIFFCTLFVNAQQKSIKLGQSKIGINQYFTITIKVANDRLKSHSPFPDISGFIKRGTSSPSSTNITNGKVTSSQSLTQNYQATKQGKFRLPAFAMLINKEKVTTTGVIIEVGKAIQQRSAKNSYKKKKIDNKDKVSEHIKKETPPVIIDDIVSKKKPLTPFEEAARKLTINYKPKGYTKDDKSFRTATIPEGIPRELIKAGVVTAWGNSAKYWQEIGAKNQSSANKLLRGLGGMFVNMLAGSLGAFGSYDFGKYLYDKGMDNAKKTYSNQLHQWSNDLKEWMNKEYPIYNSGRNDVFTAEWAGKFLQTTGYSIGLMAAHAGLAATTGGLGNIALAGGSVKTLYQGMKAYK